MPIPKHDEIHVISDLHMGGELGFQILRETKRLANFIRWVGAQCPEGEVALILNGDVIDTLAEEKNHGYIAVHNAVAILKRIIEDQSFAPIWEAMADFVKLDGRTLVFVLGNHDIELAFPVVQQEILSVLAGDDLAARSRVVFSTIGAGYLCQVGKARVFCTHGNEVDAWNFIRYEDLSRASRRINTNKPLPASDWEPNAGTKLVKDVMNGVKKEYKWIDLLKPETGAAVGVLAALDPKQLTKLKSVIPIAIKKVMEDREVDQRLSAEGYTAPSYDAEQVISADQMLGPNLLRGIAPKEAAKRIKADNMVREAESNYTDHTLDDNQSMETLGYGQLIWDRLTGWLTNVSKEEALRRALNDWLKEDLSFKIELTGEDRKKDEIYSAIMETVGPDIDFIVTGHTHLARAIETDSNSFYFNCGTWIRLLRISESMLENEQTFKPIYEVLKKGDMDSIDNYEANNEEKCLILDRTSAVCIKQIETGEVVGELAHIDYDKKETREVVTKFTRI